MVIYLSIFWDSDCIIQISWRDSSKPVWILSSSFFLLNTKEDNQAVSGPHLLPLYLFPHYKSQWGPPTVWLPKYFKIPSFVFSIRKKLIPVWHKLRLRIQYKNLHFEWKILLNKAIYPEIFISKFIIFHSTQKWQHRLKIKLWFSFNSKWYSLKSDTVISIFTNCKFSIWYMIGIWKCDVHMWFPFTVV